MIQDAYVARSVAAAVEYLYARQRADGSWCDRLSSSAIPTALAAIALHRADAAGHAAEVAQALDWLRANQRADGGWRDADTNPPSSKSGTAFALAALYELERQESAERIAAGLAFLDAAGGSQRIPGMRGPGPKSWPAAAAVAWALVGLRDLKEQPYQPIEVMLLPSRLRQKVSIALPGVLGLGLMQAHCLPSGPVRQWLHRIAEPRALAWLRAVQGSNGGIEECPMLNALVVIGLDMAGVGADISKGCRSYLLQTRRADGSWAVDRDLEISVTTYAVAALAECGEVGAEPRLSPTRDWLLSTQRREPFAPLGMPAGGWAWAVPSGWPESDDTAAVINTLDLLNGPRVQAAEDGLRWLRERQNRDGSWSEWVINGSLLNDRPCPAVTGQVITALHRSGDPTGSRTQIGRALAYLRRSQTPDGAFPSLWFRKYVFGTSKVLETYAALGLAGCPEARRAQAFLLAAQRPDGAWPDGVGVEDGTAEETAWALYALLASGLPADDARLVRAAHWLAGAQDDGTWTPSPVGLYFDDLRYNSDLIAHTFALRALARWSGAADNARR
jgi:squalene-hopene/tetraprenyl-beta-curcumene cyclase